MKPAKKIASPLADAVRPRISWKRGAKVLAAAEREVNSMILAHGPFLGYLEDCPDALDYGLRDLVGRVVEADTPGLVTKARKVNSAKTVNEVIDVLEIYGTRREEAGFLVGLVVGSKMGGLLR